MAVDGGQESDNNFHAPWGRQRQKFIFVIYMYIQSDIIVQSLQSNTYYGQIVGTITGADTVNLKIMYFNVSNLPSKFYQFKINKFVSKA